MHAVISTPPYNRGTLIHNAMTPVLPASRSPFEIVAIASSAGGVEALSRVLGDLPAGLPAAVVVAQHLRPDRPSALASVLARRTPLPVRFAEDGDTIADGTITLAPPDHHLVVGSDGLLRLTRTAHVNFSRPSDPLFISAAFHYGPRAMGVVLSGSNRDGAAGAWAISYGGGMVLVQDAATCTFPQMPRAALELGAAHYVLPLDVIGSAIGALVCRPGVAPFFRRRAS